MASCRHQVGVRQPEIPLLRRKIIAFIENFIHHLCILAAGTVKSILTWRELQNFTVILLRSHKVNKCQQNTKVGIFSPKNKKKIDSLQTKWNQMIVDLNQITGFSVKRKKSNDLLLFRTAKMQVSISQYLTVCNLYDQVETCTNAFLDQVPPERSFTKTWRGGCQRRVDMSWNDPAVEDYGRALTGGVASTRKVVNKIRGFSSYLHTCYAVYGEVGSADWRLAVSWRPLLPSWVRAEGQLARELGTEVCVVRCQSKLKEDWYTVQLSCEYNITELMPLNAR